MPTLHGISISPYVRKVKVVLDEKSIEYERNPVAPADVRARYLGKSPLGKQPFFEDGAYVLPDSSCIIAYLERAHPHPGLYPEDPEQLGRALWYEEYADTKLWHDVLRPAFFERIVKRWSKQEPDEEVVEKAGSQEAPSVFGYLEGEIGDREWFVGESFSVADVAVASPFVNYFRSGEALDTSRWPKLATYVERVHARASFQACAAEDEAFLRSIAD